MKTRFGFENSSERTDSQYIESMLTIVLNRIQ